jgi:hypothetical protein
MTEEQLLWLAYKASALMVEVLVLYTMTLIAYFLLIIYINSRW